MDGANGAVYRSMRYQTEKDILFLGYVDGS